MSVPTRGPAEHLAALLETLPPETRQQVTAWLLGTIRPPSRIASFPVPVPWTSRATAEAGLLDDQIEEPRAQRLAGALAAGEESQLVTIRLPAERHAALRAWCAEHGFTMAAVVRGLIERFLEEQGPPKAA